MFRMNWRRFPLVLFSVSLFVFLVVLFTGHGGGAFGFGSELMELRIKQRSNTFSTPRRKLLLQGTTVKEPNRIRDDKCSNADIEINQGATAPLPTGIPTYTVEILNVCASGCNISGIHLNCGWFSSAQLVNPKMFRRLSYNDCLVNDGQPLIFGGIISFKYANTFLYPMSVSRVSCA